MDIQEYLQLIPAVNAVWLTYDAEADTLYVNYKKPSHATDSEMTDEDGIIRYEGDEVIGFTVMQRATQEVGLDLAGARYLPVHHSQSCHAGSRSRLRPAAFLRCLGAT